MTNTIIISTDIEKKETQMLTAYIKELLKKGNIKM